MIPGSVRERVKSEWLLLGFGALAIVLAVADPRPLADYQRWLQLPTLAGMLGLLIAIQGIRDSGLVQKLATGLLVRAHSLRVVGLLLATTTAVLSMVLTNDVSLFLVIPLTLAIGAVSNLPVIRMVVIEALAVNAGSTLTPIGNPQNLLLWQYVRVPFLEFVAAMLPAFLVMFALVALVTWFWLPKDRVEMKPEHLDGHVVSVPQAVLSVVALVLMVVMMDHGHAVLSAMLLIVPFAIFDWRLLARIDWLLLLTFAAIFLGLGHFASLEWVRGLLGHLDLSKPWVLYLSGIAASQLISNVPATVLLMERAPDALALALAVNVGGFGGAIGSLANLIALRLANQPGGMRVLHAVSVPFLLVCAPLVYVVWRVWH